MDFKELNQSFESFKFGEDIFHTLMKKRVRRILLIASFYDAYIFEHDMKLSEQIVGEYHQLNLTTVPRITSVPTVAQALEKLEKDSFDLVISTVRTGDMPPEKVLSAVKKRFPDLPLQFLLTAKNDIQQLDKIPIDAEIQPDGVFLWHGDSRLLLAMIKQVEDRWNADYDTEAGLVRVILLVEDSVNFYSLYLPLLYIEIMEQTQRLIQEEQNENSKYHLMRTRPKVLLAKTYEEADELADRYSNNLLGIISDVEFLLKGKLNRDAGVMLLQKLRKKHEDLPILLQSSDIQRQAEAERHNAYFIYKKSGTLLEELRTFITRHFGFGDFIFRDARGDEIARATSLADFEKLLAWIPEDTMLHHSSQNHFSSWLTARGEFGVARRLKPVVIADFPNTTEMRQFLIDNFKDVRRLRNRGKILEFDSTVLDQTDAVLRIGKGSLGGKGRGLAFLNALTVSLDLPGRIPGLDVKVPITTILATSEYEDFINRNRLQDLYYCENLNTIESRFFKAEFSRETMNKLAECLLRHRGPLAVRSSGLLEDSLTQPFAGVYKTIMLPNNHPSPTVRLEQLAGAIKAVYASVFHPEAFAYLKTMNLNIEEERMAVIIQQLAGRDYSEAFFPRLSGVAQSYNFYPQPGLHHSDGLVSLALGFGRIVVEGERFYLFSPNLPEVPFGAIEDLVKQNQLEYYGMDITEYGPDPSAGLPDENTLTLNPVHKLKDGGILKHLASVWSQGEQKLHHDLNHPGPLILNFNDILQYSWLPLAELIKELLDIGEKALGMPVEMEFAVDWPVKKSKHDLPTFFPLQIRPLFVSSRAIEWPSGPITRESAIIYCENASGNLKRQDIQDLIYLPSGRFDKTRTQAMKDELARMNKVMEQSDRNYILAAPGRWGTRDHFLGIPALWSDLNWASAIVEIGLPDFDVEPSLGSHFFHNLMAMNVGYLNIPYHGEQNSFFNEAWLNEENSVNDEEFFRHLRFSSPIELIIDGKTGKALILKPKNLTEYQNDV